MLLCIVMLSAGSAFAADNTALDTAADEIAIEENVLAVDDVAAETDDVVLAAANDNVVTNDTFFNYFDEDGTLLDNVTSDELIFEGEFSDLGFTYLTINKPITFTGNDAVFDGISFWLDSNEVTIDGFTITQTDVLCIHLEDTDNVTLSNNIFDFKAVEDNPSYGIYAIDADNLQLLNNTFSYVGNTDGTVLNNAICIKGNDEKETPASGVVVSGNTFEFELPSVDVGYDPDTWESTVMSEGIVFYYCEDLKFVNNDVNVKYNKATGSYDTLYAVSVKSDAYSFGEIQSSDVLIADNTITLDGHAYAYGVYVCADDFEVRGNEITVTGETYYADGINIDGPSTNGEVCDNDIVAVAPIASYGIYSYAWMGAVESVNVMNNTVTVGGYSAAGIELKVSDPVVTDNTIFVTGNYTYGVIASVIEDEIGATILRNDITVLGTNIGDEGTDDSFMTKNSIGIDVKGTALIENNTVESTNIGIKLVEDGAFTINSNDISVDANALIDSYGIYSHGLSNLTITDNEIEFVGNTDGTVVNNGLRIEGDDDELVPASSIVVTGNTFDLALPSVDVQYDWTTWEASYMSEGVIFYYCDDVKFVDNLVNVDYNDHISMYGYYDSLYAVSARSNAYIYGFDEDGELIYPVVCSNIAIDNNTIYINGYGCVYGVSVDAQEFEIANNDITVTADCYLAHGIDVNGPSENGDVVNNIVIAEAPMAVYGIYSYQMNGPIDAVNYIDNTIVIDGYSSAGMELAEANPVVTDNVVFVDGNYTYGIIVSVKDESAVVTRNYVEVRGTNNGTDATGDSIMTQNSIGIDVKGSALIENNTVVSTNIGIQLVEEGQITMEGNTINVTANTGLIDNHAIVASEIDLLKIINNEITYVGASNKTEDDVNAKAYALYVSDSEVEVVNNSFEITVPSIPNSWIPGEGDTWVRESYSEGLVFDECDFSFVTGNDISLKYDGGSYGSIYAVDVLDCDEFVIENNLIIASGESYLYAVIVEGNNFNISKNTIFAESEYYVCGVDIEESTGGIVELNKIVAVAPESVYPIYGGMVGEPSVEIADNELYGESYFVVGVELSGKEADIHDNLIAAVGNYTIGIGVYVDDLIATNNSIVSRASNIGNKSIWDSIGTETRGIKSVKATSTVIENEIETTGKYTVEVADGTVHDNHLIAEKLLGDNSVKANGAASVYNNTPLLKVVLFASDLEKVYDDGKLFEVTALDEDGDPVTNITLLAQVDSNFYVSTTDDKGTATFDIELPAGVYNVVTVFFGDKVYGPKEINNTITVTAKETMLIAPVYAEFTTIQVSELDAIVDLTLFDIDDKRLANKTIVIKINNESGEFITDENGTAKCGILEKAGNYTLTMEFAGDEYYQASNATTEISIVPVESEINAPESANFTTVEIEKGSSPFTLTLVSGDKPLANRTVKVTLNGKTNEYTTDDNGYVVYLVDAPVGEYTLEMAFDGDELYAPSNATAEITIISGETQIIAPESVNYTISYVLNGSARFNLVLMSGDTPLANRTVNVTFNGLTEELTTDDSGNAGYLVVAIAGNYTLEMAFAGDELYGPSNATAAITITPIQSQIWALSSVEYTIAQVTSGNATFFMALIDKDLNPIANRDINVTFNGVTKEVTTDENGLAKYAINATVGNYTIDMAFEADGFYTASNASSTVVIKAEPKQTKIFLRNALYFVMETKMVRVTLWDENNNPIANKTVHIAVYDSRYSGVTDENGTAYIRVGVGFGVHNATVSFDGDDEYAACNRTGNIRVIKETPSIMVRGDNTKFKVADTKIVKVYLWDRTSKPLPVGSKVAIKVNGQTYVGTTDADGIASIKIDINKAGTYNAELKYAGNSAYNAVTKGVKFVIQ